MMIVRPQEHPDHPRCFYRMAEQDTVPAAFHPSPGCCARRRHYEAWRNRLSRGRNLSNRSDGARDRKPRRISRAG